MGLLDKAEEIKKTSEGKVSQAPSAKKETPSLLKKAEHFREVEPPIPATPSTKKESLSIPDSDSEWLDDAISDSLATEIGDLPSPDGEEEFDLSDIPELTDSDFGDLSEEHERWDEGPASNLEDDLDSLHEESNPYEPVSSDLVSDLTPDQESENESMFPEPDAIESEIEENTIVEDENPEVKPEPVQNKDKEPELGDDLIERDYHDDLVEPDVPLPEVNLFDEWENDAKKEAAKQPLRPVKEDPAPIGEEVLFDDESDFGTAPMAYHLASKKRIENYQAIFEITKEIASSKEFSDFFDNLVYSLIGQVGCHSVVILTSTNLKNSKWEAVAAQGIQSKDSWYLSPGDEIYARISDSETVIYAGEFKSSRLPNRELVLLNEMGSEILVPIRHGERCFGILSLGKLINGEEYITDDLEFAKIVGDIAGSVFERVSEFEAMGDDLVHAKEVIEINESVLQFARDFAKVRKMDEAYDLLIDHIKAKLGVKQFSFLVLDSETRSDYIVFGSNFILPERTKDFRLSKDSDIVGMVSNVSGVYKLENFREDSELKSIFTNDELGIMNEFTILPIINLNWLVGMVIIHSTGTAWTDTIRDVAVSMLETSAPVFANLLILQEKEALFRNPFNPLESRIITEMEKASSLKASFTVSLFKIQNVSRMIHLVGTGTFARYADTLRKTMMDHISELDFFTRVGQGKFVLVLHGKDKEETDVVIKKIKSSFAKKEDAIIGNFRASYRVLTLSYPHDTKDKNQFLEMVEEA
ncbi:GAF domain protein [Leptospira yanagawae serovar Saopaulo str. Sao Paulo = ATCC 700523]|uniref:GAF domain protein n=1 Tax=Leptospira yanagawae serovar Saopaulo str. Sao Paulo = ATCC 700523 TaxID=1249483 RepID=A0A5E8HDG1_9LEPT|nr:GAF domain protein [Leptospira yanagawae]EOQ88922.1 GAF domain protein [Leptospira yanagawae serovar Saopaulo str. Sao Paulo = ATCC 700523]